MGRLVGVVVLAAGLAGGVFVSAAWAQDGTVIEIPVGTVVEGAPGTVHLLATVPVDGDDVGRECGVVAQGVNNESVHPNSDLLVRSGGDEVVVPDVERAPNARTEATGTLTLGSEVSVFVQLGPDGVFSGGLVVTLDCLLPPPPPPRAVAGCVETVNPHGQNVPPAGSTTLPGPRGGQNEDGFYLLTSDPVSAGVVAIDTGSGTVFGPFPSGTKVKYTQAPGATPDAKKIGSDNGQAGAIDFHITGTGDLAVAPATDPAARTPCLVPPPPK
jgi:hypothetical protein